MTCCMECKYWDDCKGYTARDSEYPCCHKCAHYNAEKREGNLWSCIRKYAWPLIRKINFGT